MPVGFRQGLLDDAARPNWDGSGPRPLRWTAWYPAADDAVEQELFPDQRGSAWFAFGPAARDAAVSQCRKRYPIVLLSHGTGGTVMHLDWLARDLARAGFIAVGVDHHGNTITEPYRAEGFLCAWERARDLTVLLDAMAECEFACHVDIDRVYVVGYSLGGCTATALLGAVTESSPFERSAGNTEFSRGPKEFPDLADHLPGLLDTSAVFRESWARMSQSTRDPRVKAALLLAPGRSARGFSEDSLRAITTPARIIVGGADFLAPTAHWLHARLQASQLEMLGPEVGHYVFVAEATEAGRKANPDYCIDAPSVDRRAVHDHVAALAVEVFESG